MTSSSQGSSLSPEEIERYARHLVLPEIGGAGQQKLKAARVLVIGAGGLGAPVLQYLAAAGVGTLRIVDDDVVSLSNLQRQVVHGSDRLNEAKVASATAALAAINPHVRVEARQERFTRDTAAALLDGCTVAVDGSDNFATRLAVADACERAQVPLVTGAVHRFDGSLTTLMPWTRIANLRENEGAGADVPAPRYRDLYPTVPKDGHLPSCAEAGVLGATTGIVGTLQAAEVLKVITGAGEPLIGRLLLIDTLSMRFQTISYSRRPDRRHPPSAPEEPEGQA
ncbi:MAG: molybdopterin-synthase adenylyltransferase MoeB [Pseudomonadota bacterium]